MQPRQKQSPSTRLSLKKKILFRGIALMSPVILLVLLELCLRLFGCGHPTSFLVRAPDGKSFIPNWHFGRQFFPPETCTYPYPGRIAAEKKPGAMRIFVLGESAAQGTPDPSFGFVRMLEVMLREQFPEREFEVINAAMRGIDSHVIRRIALDCARYQPDLFIVYMGNNEAVGLHSPDPRSSRWASPLAFVRAQQAVRSSRLGQWLNSVFPKQKEEKKQEMEYFRKCRLPWDDPRRERIYDYYGENLADILQAAQRANAKVLVSTVAVNLRDFPPLGSLHRPGLPIEQQKQWEGAYQQAIGAESAGQFELALTNLLQAARLDDEYAELHFRLARVYLQAGQFDKAREHFHLACNTDALQFRTDGRLNGIIRMVAGKAGDGIQLVDAEKVFAESSENAIPGRRLFNDHVHFTFDGDHLMAQTFLVKVSEMLSLQAKPGATNSVPSREQCARWLGFTPWDELNVTAAVVQMTSRPPFLDQLEHTERQAIATANIGEREKQFGPQQIQQVLGMYATAIAHRPNDWQLHHTLAGFYLDLKNFPKAVEELKTAGKLFPEAPMLKLELGQAAYRAGKVEEARAIFQALLLDDPGFLPAREALAHLAN